MKAKTIIKPEDWKGELLYYDPAERYFCDPWDVLEYAIEDAELEDGH